MQGLEGFQTAELFDHLRQEGLISRESHGILSGHLAEIAHQCPQESLAADGYWRAVRNMFSFADEQVPMNAANLCPSFHEVARLVNNLRLDLNRDVSQQRRIRIYSAIVGRARETLARHLGVPAEDLALVRNTSEANCNLNNGICWEHQPARREVVIWNQNHPTNRRAWEIRRQRFPLQVVEVDLEGVTSPLEIVDRFARVVSEKTRVLSFTEVSNVSGLRLPTRQLCRLGRLHGVHVHVDGAQSWGALDLDLSTLGCQSFAASAHKWFLGPKETGILQVRKEAIQERTEGGVVEKIWPNTYGYDYRIQIPERLPGDARRFELLGQRDDPNLCALLLTADLHERIGYSRIEARIAELAQQLKLELLNLGLELVTPLPRELSHGVVVFRVGAEAEDLYDCLYRRGIAASYFGDNVRLCPHVYNLEEHVARALEVIEEWLSRSRSTVSIAPRVGAPLPRGEGLG